jgi:D-Tyr-tRNAtyr deacylase
MQDISALSAQQQTFEEEEGKVNREITAVNSSIYLVSEHTFRKKREDPSSRAVLPYAPDGGKERQSRIA